MLAAIDVVALCRRDGLVEEEAAVPAIPVKRSKGPGGRMASKAMMQLTARLKKQGPWLFSLFVL